MILHRYLMREIGRPLAAVLAILVALFASYSAAGFLSDAVSGLVPTNTIAEMIGLKALISLEVLIPISLYISIVLAFGRLYSDSEFTVMFALRVTPMRVMRAVLVLSGCLAVVVAGLSLGVRPWAYARLHALADQAKSSLNVDDMEAGTFYEGDNGNRVIFIGQRNGPKTPARNVFVRLKYNNRIEVIHARLADRPQSNAPDANPNVYLYDARVYEIGLKDGAPDRILNVAQIAVNPNKASTEAPEYSAVATSSERLFGSRNPQDVAEFQWRLSTALSTILLGMLAVPLSRVSPRQRKYAKIGTAIIVYSGYYLLCTSARTWVQNGSVPSFPGIWWAPALLALVLALALSLPGLQFSAWRRRAQQ